MEIMMNETPKIPPLEVRESLLANLRRARMDFVEADRQMDELIAKLDELLEQQRLERIEKRKRKQAAID
jgi:hypothetical protein